MAIAAPANTNRKTRKQNRREASNVVPFAEIVTSQKRKSLRLEPRSPNQRILCKYLNDPSKTAVFAVGPAGSGKTMLSVQRAIIALEEGEIEKIIITRPAVAVEEESHGFLPGDLLAKMAPWVVPIMDVFAESYSKRELASMLEKGIIEIAPLGMMRGRTMKKCYVIADECQNSTPNQMKMLLTRIGDGSRIFVTGDVKQTDKVIGENGLIDFIDRFERFGRSEHVVVIELDGRDIQRHPMVTEILQIFGDEC